MKLIPKYLNAGKLPVRGRTDTNYYGDKTHYIPVFKDDSGDVNVSLPDIEITPRNNLSLEGAVDKGRRKAAPYVGALVGGAVLGSMSSAGLLSPIVNPIDAASVITDPNNPLNWLPFGLHFGNRTYKAGRQILDPKKRAAHAYVNISPVGYDNVGKRAKSWIGDMLKGKDADIQHPKWNLTDLGELIRGYIPENVKNRELIAAYTRDDAWRIYNGLEPKYGMYIKNADDTYSYNLQKINELSDNTFKPIVDYNKGPHQDYVTGSGGGLTKYESKDIAHLNMKTYGIQTIEDVWDLHPFSRYGDDIMTRLPILRKPFISYNKLRNNLGQFFKQISIDKLSTRILPKKPYYEYSPYLKLNRFFKLFEVGTVSGGKPFKMHTEIPYTITTDLSDIFKPKVNVDYGFIPNDGLLLPVGIDKHKKGLPNFKISDNLLNSFDSNNLYSTNKLLKKKHKN